MSFFYYKIKDYNFKMIERLGIIWWTQNLVDRIWWIILKNKNYKKLSRIWWTQNLVDNLKNKIPYKISRIIF